MSLQPTRRSVAGAEIDYAAVALVVTVAGIMAGGVYLQSHVHINHDVAWILYSADRLLSGGRFGSDVIAANPPLAWWMTYPALVAKNALGIHPATAYRLEVFLLAAGMLWICHSLLYQRNTLSRWGHSLFLIIASYWFFVGCYRDFGQREYLALLLTLPYLSACLLRIGNHDVPRWQAVAVGIAAGVGLSLKPYFMAAFLCVELLVLLRTQKVMLLVRHESLAVVATILAYAGALLIWAPDYLTIAIPLIQPVYFGFEVPVAQVFQNVSTAIAGLAVLLICARYRRLTGFECVLTAAAVGFLASYLIQMKGYSYHALPVHVLVSLALAMVTADRFGRSAPDMPNIVYSKIAPAVLTAAILALNAATVINWYNFANREDGFFGQRTDELANLIERHAAAGRFMALSTHPYPGFPTALHTTADWVSRTNSQLFLPAVAKLRSDRQSGGAVLLDYAESHARDFLVRDLQMRPDLVLVDGAPRHHGISERFDLLAFYLQDKEIRELWRAYREAPSVSGYRVFIRQRPGEVR